MMPAMSVVIPFGRPEATTRQRAGTAAPETRAACADRDPAWWFEERHFARGQRLCAGCAVRERCLHEALVNGERLGVWGGLTPRERASLPDAVVVPFRRRRW